MWYRVFIIFLFAITFCGCASRPATRETGAAKLNWEGVRDVVLLKFDGSEGDAVRRDVQQRLDEVLYFRVLDMAGHPALNKITYDMVKDAKTLALSQEVGADLVVVGRASGLVDDIRGTERAEVKEGTGFFKKEKNLDGEWVDVEITRTIMRSLPYVIRHASLDVDYTVFELGRGKRIATGRISERQDKKFGGVKPDHDLEYQPIEAPPPGDSLDELSTRAASKLVAKISRMKVTATIPFDQGDNRLVRRGVVMARRGDWENAVRYWNDAVYKEPANAAAYYNLGLAHESIGDLENLGVARDFYEKAASLADNPLYVDGVTRVDRMICRGKDR